MSSSIWDRDMFVDLTRHLPSSLADSAVNHNVGGARSVSTSEQCKFRKKKNRASFVTLQRLLNEYDEETFNYVVFKQNAKCSLVNINTTSEIIKNYKCYNSS